MQKHYITIPERVTYSDYVPSHQLCYYEWGDAQSDKVVFCVHGLTRNGHEFDYIAQTLSDDYRVIAVDIVGRGESSWLENKKLYNYHTYVADCAYMIEHLALPPVMWLGSSMGGIIGMIMSATCAQLVSHLVLNDIGPQICGKSLMKIAKYVGLSPVFDNFEQLCYHCKMMYGASNITNPEHWLHIARTSSRRLHSNQFKLHYDPQISVVIQEERQGAEEDVKLWNIWNKINQPIMVLWGRESKLLHNFVAMQIQAEENVDLYPLNGVGHTPSLMDNEQISIVHKWLIKQSRHG